VVLVDRFGCGSGRAISGAVKRLLGGLGALGVLLGIWGVLVAVGLLFGAFPPIRGAVGRAQTDAPDADADADADPDAGIADAGADAARTSATPTRTIDASALTPQAEEDGTAPQADAPVVVVLAPDSADAVLRTTVCDASTRRPGLALLQLIGDPRPELAVSCGDTVHVLALDPRGPGGALVPVRVATFSISAVGTEPDTALVARATGAGDVDGDGAPDLVLGFADPADRARSGALFLVSRDASGAFARPRSLGPIAAIGVAVRALDARAGAEILALHRAQAASRRASEVWVFGGGAAPSRVALQRVGVGAEAFTIADLDRDGHDDVLVATSDGPRVDVLFGDGATAFPRSRQLAVRGAREAVAADVDGDGALDVVLGGDATLLVRAVESADAIEARPIEAANGLRLLAAGDVDASGARELIGYLHPEIVAFTGLAGATPTRRTLRILHAGEPMPVAIAVGDLDADGHAELVTLARASEESPFEIVIVPVGATPLAQQASALIDAPLVLHVTLR